MIKLNLIIIKFNRLFNCYCEIVLQIVLLRLLITLLRNIMASYSAIVIILIDLRLTDRSP